MKPNDDKIPSSLEVLELIDEFKKQIQNETIKDFLTIYKSWIPDHDAREISADKISRQYEDSKNTLVRCR